MDGEKRKPEADDAVLRGSSPKRTKEENKGVETTNVTDEEVEEFFAILRRMHVAVNYFKKGNAKKGEMRSSSTWMRNAELQNWGRNSEAKGRRKEEENVEENTVGNGLDLNAEPGTGSDPF